MGFPSRPHPLVGRQHDLKAAEALLLRGDVRLVTVIGPPGVGKTRFAVEVGARVAPEFDHGAVFVDLAVVRDAGLVLDAIGQALGVSDHPDQPVLQRLRRWVTDRNVLLLLDNLEHVIGAAGGLAELLDAGPHLKMLVTSRQPLHVRWEHRYDLLPLPLPPPGADHAAIARSAAAALFLERARGADPGFALKERSAAVVGEICRRLDGLPLAIELAAAWIGVLGLDGILSRLSARGGLPRRSRRDAPERQRTLLNAIAWSYDLLDGAERTVFGALAACEGETPLEAIESVCQGLRVDILTPVAGLVDKHLLVRVGGDEAWFRMLETIREFAEERLALTAEANAARRRHAVWFLGLARQAERFIWSEQQAIWLARLDRAHDNVRAALRWCLGGGDEETGVLLTAAMHRFWFARGYIREGRRWCEIAATKEVSARARALALRNLAFFLVHHGEIARAVGLAEQAAALARTVDDPSLMAWILLGRALTLEAGGDTEGLVPLYREMLETARRCGDAALEARALANLGDVMRIRGDRVGARAALEAALAIARPRQDKWLISVVTGQLAAALAADAPGPALAQLEESLALCSDIGHRWLIVRRLEDIAALLASSERAAAAATLLGACESLRESLGSTRSDSLEEMVKGTAAAARDRLGAAAFEAAWNEGRAMTADEATALALGRPVPVRPERTPRAGGLTGREAQIALDIAGGLTNRQIAGRLGISERTVDAHVQNIRNKLGMDRRAQIAAWASVHLSGRPSA